MVGTVIMAHGDDDGVILPPRVAPEQIVIIPITPKPEMRDAVLPACDALAAELRKQTFGGEPVRVHVDKRDLGGGVKSWEWIKKGVPVRVEIGLRDLEKGSVAVARRDRGHKEKTFPATADFTAGIAALLQEIHDSLLDRATKLRDAHTLKIETKEDFIAYFTAKNPNKPEIHGGFASAHWDGTAETEAEIKEQLKVTIRCIPFDAPHEDGQCVWSGKPSTRRVIFAKSY
jgi:prolyl-tRNA synthetase